MANRKTKFLLKRSNVPGKIPLPGDLLLGELALNTSDAILYTSGTTEGSILPIGWDRIHRTGDTINGDLIITSGLTASTISISSTPINDNTLTQILARDSITGEVKYRDASTLIGSGATNDIYVTGTTWDSSGNTLTLYRNDGFEIDQLINITNIDGNITISGKTIGDSSFKNWSQWYINGSTTATTTPVSTPVKVGVNPPVIWSDNSKGFGFSAGTLTFTGDSLQEFHITMSMTAQATANNQLYEIWVEKNGVVQENLVIENQFGTQRQAVPLTGIITLSPNDSVSVYIQNNTANKDITINYINFSIVQI